MSNGYDDDEYLPPDDEYGEGEYPFDESNYPEIWGSYEGATEAYDFMADYFQNTGFSNESWFEIIHDAEIYYDENGEIEYIEFDWQTDGGCFGGHGIAHA